MKTSVKILGFLTLVSILLFAGGRAVSHCQIPCGIYGDQLRFELLKEHIQTIEKSMKQINELSANPSKDMNQLVRWVSNKELHAEKFNEIVTYYFMAQRVSPVDKNEKKFQEYVTKITLLHKMQVASMKCKQTTDLKNTAKLLRLVKEFEAVYMGRQMKADKAHDHGHSHTH